MMVHNIFLSMHLRIITDFRFLTINFYVERHSLKCDQAKKCRDSFIVIVGIKVELPALKICCKKYRFIYMSYIYGLVCLFYMCTTQMFCEMCEKRLQLCERSSIATRILRYEPVLYNLTSFVLLGPFFVFFFAWLIRFSTFSNACSLAHSHARTLSLS